MSDDEQRPDATPGPASPEPGTSPAPGRARPSPASRARRIGGRPAGPAPATAPDAAPGTAPGTADDVPDAAGTSDPAPAGRGRTSLRKTPAAETTDTAARPAAPAPGWLRWLPAAALTVAAIVMIVFFAIASHGVWWARPSANAVRDEVLSAAKQCVVATNSYDYKTISKDAAAGAACTTGPQTQKYQQAIDRLVRPQALKYQVSQQARISTAGVQSVTSDGRQWSVLVFGQLTIHASKLPAKGRIDPFAAVVRMDRVGGSWLIDSIQPVAGTRTS